MISRTSTLCDISQPSMRKAARIPWRLKPLEAAAKDLLEVARILFDLPRQLHLVAEVVVDDPLIPEERRGVNVVVPFAGKNGMRDRRAWGQRESTRSR